MKKNVLKKFAAAALAAATVMSSMSVMAFADDTGSTAKTGSVTITKYMGDTKAGDTLSPENYTGVEPTGEEKNLLQGVEFAYVEVGKRVQVDTGEGKSSQTEIQYNVTNDDFLQAIGIKTGVGKNYTQSELNNKVSDSANKTAVINFVKNNKKSNAKVTDKNGTASFTGLDLNALYVFAETDATNAALANDGSKVNVTKVSVPFLVSLPFTGKDGKTVTELNVYPKNSTGTESIDKKINKVGKTEVNGIKANANIGDIITYKVTYSVPVPENGLTELKIVDTMDKGLTFTNAPANITVEDDNVGTSGKKELVYDKDYQVLLNSADNKVTIDFENYLKSLQSNSTEEFTITYKVKLNENAVLGQTGNKNKVELQYNNGTTIDKTVPGNDTKVFTYGIDLLKKGEGKGTVLAGVTFTLTDESNTAVNVDKKTSNTFYTPGGKSNEVETDADGKIYIRGLKPGTYKLTETKTKDGYVLLKDPVVIKITPSTNEEEAAKGVVTAYVGTKEVTMTDDNGSATAIVPLTVVNSKGFDLPATGGRGIALFTIAGIAIVAAAGSLLFMRKRSK
ncbi:MAG: SpaH/EbpB family LPXTG-anchored major pilin [Clostridiales bacterium]|nr:SpaH/EbpB family LPXTG-anchored major pilin [Clostridiales bacterium]